MIQVDLTLMGACVEEFLLRMRDIVVICPDMLLLMVYAKRMSQQRYHLVKQAIHFIATSAID